MVFILEFWHWFALALIFIVIEALLISGVFLALTISSSISGGLLWVYPDLEWKLQLVIFATISLICVLSIRKIFEKRYAQAASDQESTTDLIGKTFILKLPIQNGFGEIEIDGKNWAIKGRDQKVGTQVTVVGIDGHFLSVFPFTTTKDKATEKTESSTTKNDQPLEK